MDSILNNLPANLCKYLISQGLELSFSRDAEQRVYLNLNTGMKSHCWLYFEDGSYVCRMRYDEVQEVKTLSDILYCIKNCKHRKDFMHSVWADIIEDDFYFTYEDIS